MISISLCRKPLIGTVGSNVAAYGTGGINIDGCRIPVAPWETTIIPSTGRKLTGNCSTRFTGDLSLAEAQAGATRMRDYGRWPANLILSQVALPDKSERYFYQTE